MTSLLIGHTLDTIVGSIECSSPFSRPPPSAYDEIITLTVGQPDVHTLKVFRVYRGVLCHYSDYFKTMLDGSFEEGGSTELIIDDVAPEIFQLFYDFIKTGSHNLAPVDDIFNGDEGHDFRRSIVEAYIFADFYLAQSFKNAMLDLFFAAFAYSYMRPADVLHEIYDNTPEGAPLRKLIVDIHVDCWTFKTPTGGRYTVPEDMLVELLAACREKGVAPGSMEGVNLGRKQWMEEMCEEFCAMYHDHSEPAVRGSVKKE